VVPEVLPPEPVALAVQTSTPALIPDVCDSVEYVDMTGETREYRVTGWLRKYRGWKYVFAENQRQADALEAIWDVHECNPYANKYEFCTKEEATHVSISEVASQVVPVEKVRVVGRIGWSQNVIDQETKHAMEIGAAHQRVL